MSELKRLFQFLFIAVACVPQAYAADSSNDGFFVSIGYGRLTVSDIVVATNPNPSNPPEAFLDDDWDLFLIGGGFGFNEGKTQLLVDVLLSEKKHLKPGGTRDLLGGGTTNATFNISHVGLFVGLRQQVYSKFYLSAGIGGFSQEKKADYDVLVVNSGAAGSEEFGGYFVGADFAVSDSVLVGIRQYMTEGDGEGDPQFDAIVLGASFSF